MTITGYGRKQTFIAKNQNDFLNQTRKSKNNKEMTVVTTYV